MESVADLENMAWEVLGEPEDRDNVFERFKNAFSALKSKADSLHSQLEEMNTCPALVYGASINLYRRHPLYDKMNGRSLDDDEPEGDPLLNDERLEEEASKLTPGWRKIVNRLQMYTRADQRDEFFTMLGYAVTSNAEELPDDFVVPDDKKESMARVGRVFSEAVEMAMEKRGLKVQLFATRVNSWYCYKYDATITVWRNEGTGKVSHSMRKHGASARHRFFDLGRHTIRQTMIPTQAEERAMATLRSHIGPAAYREYVLHGSFQEVSERSGLRYVFRKNRPTLVYGASRVDERGVERRTLLCGLCLHPFGFYQDTFVGALCPTDDVIAHLLLVRGDEKYLWRKSNQHGLDTLQIGL